jgi:hypothetical protein
VILSTIDPLVGAVRRCRANRAMRWTQFLATCCWRSHVERMPKWFIRIVADWYLIERSRLLSAECRTIRLDSRTRPSTERMRDRQARYTRLGRACSSKEIALTSQTVFVRFSVAWCGKEWLRNGRAIAHTWSRWRVVLFLVFIHAIGSVRWKLERTRRNSFTISESKDSGAPIGSWA